MKTVIIRVMNVLVLSALVFGSRTAFVIGAIAADLLNLLLDLLKQVFEDLRIGDVVGRHHRRDDLTRGRICTQMQFPPSPPLAVAVLTNFPFAFAKNFHARRINDHVQRRAVVKARQSYFQDGTAAAQLAVIDHRQIQSQQLHERQHQAARGTQGQVIDLLERRHAQDGGIGVGARSARLASFFSIAPSRDNLIADPEGQASALHERRVILFPVAEAVSALGFLGLHTSRLPALPSPCFMQQRHFDLKDDPGAVFYDLLWTNVYRTALPASPEDERQAQTPRP